MILWQGPSLLDGAPIVVIATLRKQAKRANKKTGNMVQTWILRSDIPPAEAVQTGQDASICGDCSHRGTPNRKRSCYVKVWQAPRSVYEAYKRGRYSVAPDMETVAAYCEGLEVRIGAYGDGAAVPAFVWRAAVSRAAAWTGYSHQWRTCDQELRHLLMASCDKPRDGLEASLKGWRTFRVRAPEQPLAAREISCPASKEAEYKTTCAACRACGGLDAKARANIAIIAHGSAAKHALAIARA